MLCSNVLLLLAGLILWISESALTSNCVSEGGCGDVGNDLQNNLNQTWFAEKRQYYFPMASEHFYRLYAGVFLGRSPNSEEELYQLKLITKASPPRFTTSAYGSKETIRQVCIPDNVYKGRSNCLITKKCTSPKFDTSLIENVTLNLIYTDNKSLYLSYHCVDGEQDYAVISVSPTLTSEMKAYLQSRIEELGLDTELIRYMIY